MSTKGRSVFGRLYLWACQRLYYELAWAYDPVSWLVSAGRWQAWRELALAQLPPGRVLEVGFGTGELLLALARRGWQVSGLELSPAMQRITRRKLAAAGLAGRMLRVRGLAQRLPFPNGYFDAVVATFPAEYVFDQEAEREFARVLRDPNPDAGANPGSAAGGRLVIGGLAIAIDNPRLARLAPLFYGLPPAEALARWQRSLAGCGLQARPMVQQHRGAQVLMIVAEKIDERAPARLA